MVKSHSGPAEPVRVKPVTTNLWEDVERLAGKRGFYSGCWCMWWRLTSQQWEDGHGEGNRKRLASLIGTGDEPGLLAYAGKDPVGWIAVAPRTEYPRLGRSPKLKPIDDQLVWSISCFYIDRHHRRRGIAKELLAAAVNFAFMKGAEVVEAYPIDTSRLESPASAALYTGTLSMFEEAGFREVARRGGRPIVRFLPR